MDLRKGPSAEATRFANDPANRIEAAFDPADLRHRRRRDLAHAKTAAQGLARDHGIDLNWEERAGRDCLIVTPKNGKQSSVTLLYLFGGGFVTGGPLEDLPIIASLVADTGMQAIAPVYRLAPEHPWPAALEDARAVADSIARDGPFQIAGESAGGNLALCVAQSLAAQQLPLPSALALLSPAVDLSDAFDPFSAPDDPVLPADYVAKVPDVYAPGADHSCPDISPIYGSFGPDWPDTIITTGTRDRFLGQCARLDRAIRDDGGQSVLRVWDGLWHVFEYYPDIPEAALSLREIADFLKHQAEV